MFHGKVILVVDDEADLREILRDELVYEGATVIEAANGKEALEHLGQRHFDAVLSDIRMPGGDGATLTREIRKVHSSQPVIVLITGFADLHSEEAFDMGADGYMTKPFHLDELKSGVKRLLTPSNERWATPQEGPVQRQIQMKESFEESFQKGRFKLGRGGFCLNIDPQHTRPGDLVEIIWTDLTPIRAQVRWARSEAVNGRQTGLGLEFVQVSELFFQKLNQVFPQWNSERSFIPRA